MKLWSVTILATALILFLPISANAKKSVEDLLAEIDSAQQEIQQLDEKAEENVRLKREIEQEYAAMEPEWNSYRQEANSYEASCLGRNLQTSEYNVCMSRWRQVEGARTSLQSRQNSIDRKDKQRVAEATRMYKQRTRLQNRVEQLRATLQATQFGQSNQDCLSRGSDEAVHHCMQQRWDGAR